MYGFTEMTAIKVAKMMIAANVLAATLAWADTPANAVVPPDIAHTILRCAPQVAPSTILNLVRTESAFDPNLIGVNGDPHQTITAKTSAEAIAKATQLLAQGKNIDMGLGQINSTNLARLKLSVADAFNPCRNIKAAAQLLTEDYLKARPTAASDQAALDAALSAYNTGTRSGGLANGYVAQVRGTYTVPSIDGTPATGTAANPATRAAVQVTAERPAPAPSWDVFGRASQPVAAPTAQTPAAASSTAAAPKPVMVFNAASAEATP